MFSTIRSRDNGIIGKFHTHDHIETFVERCKEVWATVETPNTVVVLAAGKGIIEKIAIANLDPKPQHVVSIDPFQKGMSYEEAKESLGEIENRKGIIIGANVALLPSENLTLEEMYKSLEIVHEWPRVIVASPTTSFWNASLESLFSKADRIYQQNKKKEEERQRLIEQAAKEREEERKRQEEEHKRFLEAMPPEEREQYFEEQKKKAEEQQKKAKELKLRSAKEQDKLRKKRNRFYASFRNHSR